jgi:signal transduction histidine kinase/ligand-binding sensor domain-containing protein
VAIVASAIGPGTVKLSSEGARLRMGGNKRGPICVSKCLILLSLILWLGIGSRVCAQDQSIAQMVRTVWTGRDGAPQAVTALAQTPDGTLWIGSQGGLSSFDGLKFAAFQAKPGSPPLSARTIRFLFVSKAGDLWAFPFHGPPTRIHQGELRVYDRVEGEHLDVLGHAQEDSNGTLWAVLNERHLIRLGPDDVWQQVADPIEGTGHISKLFIDSSDTQWVIENNLLYRRPVGQADFISTGIYVYGPAKIVECPDHSLWVKGWGPNVSVGPARAFNLQHVDRTGTRLPTTRVSGAISDILVASDGALWISKANEGLQRLGPGEVSETKSGKGIPADLYKASEGVTWMTTLLSDADGNIWAGEESGLERFEHSTLVPAIAGARAGDWYTCVDPQGDVWIASGDDRIFVVKDGRTTQVYQAKGLTDFLCGNKGGIYVLDSSGITALRNGEFRHLPLLPNHTGYTDHYMFLGLLELSERDLLAAVGGATGHGLWRYSAGRWSRFLSVLALPEVCGMLADARGRIYLAFTGFSGSIRRIEGDSAEVVSTPPGQVVGFAQTSYGVFAYGANGIAVDRGKSLQMLSFVHPEQATMVTGLVESRNGDLWMNGAHGIVRVPATEVLAAVADPAHPVSSINLREGDFVGPDLFMLFRKSAHIDSSGTLWFSMLNGVVSVDPKHLAAPRHPPRLSIRAITADGRPLDAKGAFPPGIHYLEVQYFGLDLTSPKDVIYRYRLKGLDTAWQDVGSRTEAIYTHLRAGSYIFQVMASNGNDIWTTAASSVPFTILPHFYERRWVQALFVLAGAVLVWAGVSLRVRYVSGAIRIRAEERADERIRIARELHDTLLQGVQGLLLSFHVAAEKVPADHESKRALEKALTTADRIILEGRNRVTRLRSENLTDTELKPSIERVAADLNSIATINFAVERRGGSDTLHSHVVDEIFCIAREALTNAFRHSEASRIVVELDYQKREFRMTCRDNGRGFDADALLASPNGHWGLPGMAERAKKIGADFRCASAAEKGTEVLVTVPARRAYARPSRVRQLFARDSST